MDSNATSYKVLIVDDMGFMRTLLKRQIEDSFQNVQCTMVNNGEDAKDKLLINKYDIILSDWEMPKMNGFELLEWIRNDPEFDTVPFIFVTGDKETEHIKKAVQLGIAAYLFKPFSVVELRQKIVQVSPKFDNCKRS